MSTHLVKPVLFPSLYSWRSLPFSLTLELARDAIIHTHVPLGPGNDISEIVAKNVAVFLQSVIGTALRLDDLILGTDWGPNRNHVPLRPLGQVVLKQN